MKNLFEPFIFQEFKERIVNLRPDAQPKWGTMDVAEMLAHCSVLFALAFENKPFKVSFMSLTYGVVSRLLVFSEKPFKRNLPAPKSFKVAKTEDFEKEKVKLLKLVQQFSKTAKTELENRVHPYYGKLTAEQWNFMEVKHLDHHLQQFGV